MDFHHLKYFTEVARHKSFSKAARHLHISQSAISRTIKALEEELGVTLFLRNAKAVELTDAGTLFLNHAKRNVFMFEHLKTDFENEFKLEQGSIHLGLPPITDSKVFARLIGEFKKKYPQIDVELYEYGSKKVEIAVQEGLTDVGIICTEPKDNYESLFLLHDPVCALLPATHPLAAKEMVSLKELANDSFVLYRDDFNLHDEIIAQCQAVDFTPKVMFETAQRDLMIQTVSAELGIALLPERLCPTPEENGRAGEDVAVRPLEGTPMMHRLYAIWRKGHYLSHAAKLWLEFTEKQIRRYHSGDMPTQP